MSFIEPDELAGAEPAACPNCGETEPHDVDCRTCFDCSKPIDGFVPAKPTRDRKNRCERCYELRWALQNTYRRALKREDAESEAFVEAMDRHGEIL